MKLFWSVVFALIALTLLALLDSFGDPSEGAGWAIFAGMALGTVVVMLGGLRASLHIIQRDDFTQQDKRIWLLWMWIATPLTVPLYLRRARL